MFDGLKDKLTRFTEDVSEDATAADADAPENTEGESPPEQDTTLENEADGNTADAGHDPSRQEAQLQNPESPAGGSGTPDEDGRANRSPEADQKTATQDEGAQNEDEERTESRGLTERAKLFATGRTVIDEDDLEGHLDELEFALLGNDVELSVTENILEGVEQNLVGETRRRLESTGNLAADALREALYDVISVGQFDFDERIAGADKPVVIIFTGVNGVGKTTTIAKMARYLEARGHSSVLANGDTFRAGANEQLEQHADALGKKIISHEQGSDPAAVLYDAVEYAGANDVDVVLGDTAGRLHTDEGLMDQLAKIERVIDPDMTLFVDEAVAGQDAVNRAREFDNAAEIDGTALTKADADSQGGAAISVAHVTGKPILFLGTGQGYEDLERFDPERIVNELLET
jgi:fused signal recognition particle receptor